MKRLVLTYDTEGNLINSEEIEVPDPVPTEMELLKAEVESLKERITGLEKNVSIR